MELRKVWCFLFGHDYTEFYEKSYKGVVYYKDRQCNCGHKEILINNYVYELDFIEGEKKDEPQ